MSGNSTPLRKLAAATAVVGLLAGCASGIMVVSSVDQDPSDFFHYRAAASDGTVHVATAGRARGMGGEDLKEFVARQFSSVNVRGPAATFSSDPATMDYGGLRFVVAFNPGPDLDIYSLCKTPASALAGMTGDGDGDGLQAIAAFCNGNDTRYWAKARAAEPEVSLEAFTRRLARDVIPKPISGRDCETIDC